MSVEGPCQSQKLPVTSIRQLNKLAKNVSSMSKDDSLTSLDWLSCLGTPQPSVKEPRPAQYTPKELIRLSFRLARHDVLTIQEMVDMAQRLSLKISKNDIEIELRRSSEFNESPSGWKLTSGSTGSSHDGGRPAKRAKISDSQDNHVNIIVDSSSLRQSQEMEKISPLNGNAYCPDLSNVLIDFGIPIMNDAVPMEDHASHGMSCHLPMLEVTGARIPTPEDWIKDEYSNYSVSADSPQSHDDLFTSSDVDTPFLVDSWLQDTFFDYSH
ncbi:unnamed protein product [Oikopleura dioica]|uniref:Uncharacterized protein n=1 Tax=Oikopleura dioica TaxID=34765 RepID=E4XVB8_OIKDI|nr:unnamed protein product [Oikopleura dioica]